MWLPLCQCLKYYRGKERKINGNVRPFTKAKSHFACVSFFEENDAPKETIPLTITSTGKSGAKNTLQMPKENVYKHPLKKEESKQGDIPSSDKQANKNVAYPYRDGTDNLEVFP